MISIHATLPAAAVLCLAGCATPAPTRDAVGPRVNPALVLAAPIVPAGSVTTLDGVIDPPAVSAYTVGRTVDPADPHLLHEAHVVYRREAGAAWRLAPPSTPAPSLAPGSAASAPAAGRDPVQAAELDGVLSELRRTAEENRQAIALLFQAVEALGHTRAPAPTQAPTPAVAPPERAAP